MLLSLTTTQDQRSHRLADQKRPNVGAYLPYKGYNCYQTNYCAEPADKQGNAYNMPHVQHSDNTLNPDALRRCLLALVERRCRAENRQVMERRLLGATPHDYPSASLHDSPCATRCACGYRKRVLLPHVGAATAGPCSKGRGRDEGRRPEGRGAARLHEAALGRLVAK